MRSAVRSRLSTGKLLTRIPAERSSCFGWLVVRTGKLWVSSHPGRLGVVWACSTTRRCRPVDINAPDPLCMYYVAPVGREPRRISLPGLWQPSCEAADSNPSECAFGMVVRDRNRIHRSFYAAPRSC